MTEMEFPTFAAAAAWIRGVKGYRNVGLCQRLVDTPGSDETDPTILVGLGHATPRTAHLLLQEEAPAEPKPEQDTKPASKKVKKKQVNA